MILYHSALSLQDEWASLLPEQVRVLYSFCGYKHKPFPKHVGGVLLDSGAFSVRNSGKKVTLEVYIKFLKDHASAFDAYSNLDVIGNPRATAINQGMMENEGLHPMAVFHAGSDPAWLVRILKKQRYIAIGGMVGKRRDQLIPMLDHLFGTYLCSPDTGHARVKVHGFGVTDFVIMARYPWHSVDSTTAARAGRCGVILSKWGQLRVSTIIKTETSATIATPELQKELMRWWARFLPKQLRFTWEELSGGTPECGQKRILVNACYIETLVKNTTPTFFPSHSESDGLFDL